MDKLNNELKELRYENKRLSLSLIENNNKKQS